MKALTVQQPWAWAIVHGGLRTVPEIAAAAEQLQFVDPDLIREEMRGALVTGAVLGVVDLVGIHTAEDGCCESWWAETSYAEHGGRTRRDLVHLVLEHPRPLRRPIPARGRLGLWDLDGEQLAAVLGEGIIDGPVKIA